MDKKEFVEQMIVNVRNLPISSVVGSKLELKRRGGQHHMGLCPFHNDERLGSFVVTDSKGVFKCFACGTGGDAAKFIALSEGINYLEASFKIAVTFGIITPIEYDEYFARRRYTKEQVEKIERKYDELDKQKTKSDIADVEILDMVYRIFIESSSLSEEHQTYLNEERNLDEDAIHEGSYFTFPTRRILKDFMIRIRETFGSEAILKTVPGFYFDKSENRMTFTKNKGLGMGIKNAKGLIVGIQIRRDDVPEGAQRYIWFSSSFANYDDNYDFGTSSGSPIDVVYPIAIKTSVVFITEGRFKAKKLAQETGSVAISVQGVGSWKGIIKTLKEVPNSPTMKRLRPNFKLNCILLAYDADISFNIGVFEQARKLSDTLKESGYITYYLHWDEALGKGVDDLYNNGHQGTIRRYEKGIWDKKYLFMIDKLKEEVAPNYDDNVLKIPKDVIKDYFKRFVKITPLEHKQMSKEHQEQRSKIAK